MNRMRTLLIGVAAAGLLASGVGVAGALQDAPQDATPTPDPIGDIIRDTPQTPGPDQPVEPAPAGQADAAVPVAVNPTDPAAVAGGEATQEGGDKDEDEEEDEKREDRAEVSETLEEPVVPTRRQRRRVAIVEAIDKITAESMRFEVEVGGRPVRFNNALIFSARACEVSAPEELVEDSIAYMDISLQSRGTAQATQPRQIFRGWMFASTPAVSGLQHPIYDAWIVGCKA